MIFTETLLLFASVFLVRIDSESEKNKEIRIEQLQCGQTIILDRDLDQMELHFTLKKQRLEWVKNRCVMSFKTSGIEQDGMLLTFISHSIPSSLPRCKRYALIFKNYRTDGANSTNEPVLKWNNSATNDYYSSVKLCSQNWVSSMSSFITGNHFGLEVKHPLVANTNLKLDPVVKGEEINHELPKAIPHTDGNTSNQTDFDSSQETDKEIMKLISEEEENAAVSKSIESIAPDTDFSFRIMITSVSRSSMKSLTAAVRRRSYVRNGDKYNNISSDIIATKDWPLTSVIESAPNKNINDVFSLQPVFKKLNSGWVFFLLNGPEGQNETYLLNNCSGDSGTFVSFTITNTMNYPETHCGFDHDGSRVIGGGNVTIQIKYSPPPGNQSQFPSGILIGYLAFSEQPEYITIPNWAVFMIVTSSMMIFIVIVSISIGQKKVVQKSIYRRPLLTEEDIN